MLSESELNSAVFKRYQRVVYGIVVALVTALATAGTVASESRPWRVNDAAALPAWLSISGSHRTRWEVLDGQYRAGRNGGDQAVMLRTLLRTDLKFDAWHAVVEIQDSRVELADSGTPISQTMVNPAELLQGYLAWRHNNLLSENDRSELRAGRLTINVGSRRFIARNLFRNTLNAFTGIEWAWDAADGRRVQAFYTLPVNRKPNTAAALLDNDVIFDEEHTNVRLWGLYYRSAKNPSRLRGEIYLFGLDEEDNPSRASRNRDLYTVGFRAWRPALTEHFDFLVESVFQSGESRSSTAPTNLRDLDHFAHFQHAEIGYTFGLAWSPRVLLQYDYASGDDDPNDGNNERFDTLFGARRFDFGPTSLFGAFARSNLSTPGIRILANPRDDVKLFVAWRGFWLASDQDAWTTSRVRDRQGQSGSFIGHQVEARFRWEVIPGNYRFEAGIAHLFDGEFMRNAPNANGEGDATYLYSQAIFRF